MSRLTGEIDSATQRAPQFRPSLTNWESGSILDPTRWHPSRDPQLKNQEICFQRSIKCKHIDAENSRFYDSIAQDKAYSRSTWKTIKALRNKKFSAGTLRKTDPEKAKSLPIPGAIFLEPSCSMIRIKISRKYWMDVADTWRKLIIRHHLMWVSSLLTVDRIEIVWCVSRAVYRFSGEIWNTFIVNSSLPYSQDQKEKQWGSRKSDCRHFGK